MRSMTKKQGKRYESHRTVTYEPRRKARELASRDYTRHNLRELDFAEEQFLSVRGAK